MRIVPAHVVSLFLTTCGALTAQAAWTRVYPAVEPSLQWGAGMAFDEARGAAVLVGGAFVTNPMLWDGTAWTSLPLGPSGRYWAQVWFDAAHAQTVVFGGVLASTGTPTGDTWTWNGTAWAQRSPPHAPSARYAAATAYDPGRGVAVLFGGFDQAGNLGDTWEWNGTDWQHRVPAASPAPRALSAATFDPNTGKVLMFGGRLTALGGQPPCNETWLWDGNTWERRFPANPPYIRANHCMATDAARRRVVMIGSNLGNDPFAWEWDGTNWAMRATAGPTPVADASMCFDSVRREVVLFGGQFAGGYASNETWLWRTPQPASFAPYGTGCPGGNGVPVLRPAPYELPWLGDTFHAQVTDLPATAGAALFVLGLHSTPATNLAAYGLPACDLFTTIDESVFVPVNAGTAVRALHVPNQPALAGLALFEQAAVFDTAAPGGASLTQAAALVVGVR